MQTVILKGTIIHTPTKDRFDCHPGSLLVAEDGVITGIFREDSLPERLRNIPVHRVGNKPCYSGTCEYGRGGQHLPRDGTDAAACEYGRYIGGVHKYCHRGDTEREPLCRGWRPCS